MPYFVPACALSTIGISTITFARKIVRTACHQFMPSAIIPLASIYVGTHAAIEIHSAAISRTPHFRCESGTGAMSALKYCDDSTAGLKSWK